MDKFHNTTDEKGERLKKLRKIAKTQTTEVLRVLQQGEKLTSFQIEMELFHKYRTASVTRAIHTLEGLGKIKRCLPENKVMGNFGVMVHTWEAV